MEGGTVMGVGDRAGSGNAIMEKAHLDIEMKAGSAQAYGTKSGMTIYRDVKETWKVNV